MYKHAPSFTTEGIWEFLGGRGVHSASPSALSSAFDYLQHNNGVLIYMLKPDEDVRKLTVSAPTGTEPTSWLFDNCVFSDPMQNLSMREETGDKFTVCFTHDTEGKFEPYDELEAYGSYATAAEMTCVPPETLTLFTDLP